MIPAQIKVLPVWTIVIRRTFFTIINSFPGVLNYEYEKIFSPGGDSNCHNIMGHNIGISELAVVL